MQNLPRWARDHATVAAGTSAFQHNILPREWVEKVFSSKLEKSLWSAIGQTDWPGVIELASEGSFDSLPLATQLYVSQLLIEIGPSEMAAWANAELEWVLMRPKEVRNEWQAPISVSEDGWIEVEQVGGSQFRVMIDVPTVPLNLFRIETYCGPRLPVTKDSLETEEQSDVVPMAILRTAPTAKRIEENSNRVGPGLAGEGPDFCLIREIRFRRVNPDRAPAELQFSRVYSGHTTIPGREADFALDREDSTVWGLGHSEASPLASTFFETRPLTSAQLHPSLLCEIDSGGHELWQWTALGRFRLYYATEPTLPKEAYSITAEQILKRLNRRYPANSRILGLQARLGNASGLLERRNREAALALPSTAASIDGLDIAALKLFTDMTLALHPPVENPSYQQLLDQIQSVSGSRAAFEATQRIALYQRERGDRMFSLHPATSLEAYSEAERLDPIGFNRHGRLAWELSRSKRQNEAMSMARKGVAGENCEWEDLFYFGSIAIRTENIQEAWKVFEQRMQTPEFRSNSQLRLIHGRLAFLNGSVETGIQILEELGSKIAESPAIISAAAHGLATSNHQSRVPWLLKIWQQYDHQEISESPEFSVRRKRRYAWSTLAFAAVHAGFDQEFLSVLEEHTKSHPQLLDEIALTMDQLLLARVTPQSEIIDLANSRKLIEVYHALEPEEARWKIRAAILTWLQGHTGETLEILESLPFDQNGDGDSILRSSQGRIWQAMARVCLATFRILRRVDLESDAKPEVDVEHEIDAAQKCLGRVPEGDRDLAEWLWWEYRLRSMPKVSPE